ncbi:MAG: universal stress protein [Chitinophagaceae bacterium]|nr:universal stress protein [Chitinophagaceae bacterium]
MRRILVPTDFSNNAFKALAYAAELSRANGGMIYLLHVIEPSLNMATMKTDSLSKRILKERSDKLLLTLESAAKVYPKVKILPFVEGGKVAGSIMRFAAAKRITAIVMGTKGAGGLKKFLLGTVASAVAGKANVPVLTIPASYEIRKPEVVLFATNRFEKSKRLLNKAMSIPQLFKTDVHVVIFKEKRRDKIADYIYNDEQLKRYLQFLKELYPKLKFKGIILEGEDFEREIEEYADETGCDLMTMVPYPKSFFEKVFQRSETKKMIFHSTKPVMAIPAIPFINKP